MDTPKGSQPQNPIATCATMLSLRHFSALRDFASRLPSSDCVARIIAIADVLSAADFYSVLKLRRDDAGDRDLTRSQFAKLALLLDPTSTDKFPFSDEALLLAREAWHVLSDPERRALYDREFEQRSGGDRRKATFWTGCPYCGNLYEFEKRYEECTLLCQNCRKAFHGVAMKPPVKEGDEKGEDYWSHESVPLRYYEVKEKEDNNNMMGLGKIVIEGVKGDVRSEGWERVHRVQVNETVNLQGNGKRRMRIKTVAKKGVWNRNKRSKKECVDADSDLDLDVEDGELEFTQGDGDVFVGVRFNK
ncbi:uncharacterized protein LOC133298240 [Gastrolobium bilobum]|uniref:uncharacterized protein LOC133297097 n=1 Tax=Gastrolobium bilobum TaxID=150636 RepID=UPI002AB0C06F|nr:uncharacterized protein LOC133297097 [Gastrolobium bilobum]XP_061353483.1 uncharacterized protein LOC133298240 [Gastrolobium bilobum]